jgi:hypothetical protein
MQQDKPKPTAIVWRQPNGDPVTCYDKIAVLNDNLSGLQQECQDVLEDALLMGCDEKQARDVLRNVIDSLENPFKK